MGLVAAVEGKIFMTEQRRHRGNHRLDRVGRGDMPSAPAACRKHLWSCGGAWVVVQNPDV